MKTRNPIEFPANPFVVLADMVIILLLLLILTVVMVSTASSDLLQQVAVRDFQSTMADALGVTGKSPYTYLNTAFSSGIVRRTWTEGDLQRYWFDGREMFAKNSVVIKPNAQEVLLAFGKQLAKYHSVIHSEDPYASGAYKYILIEGHAGDDEANAWEQSYLRAKAVADLWQHDTGLDGKILKIVARGQLDAGDFSFTSTDDAKILPEIRRQMNPRVEIIVVYSQRNAAEKYLEMTGHGVQ